MDRVEEVKYHGKQAIDKCAMLVGLVCGMMVVLGGFAYAVEQVVLFRNRHDIRDVDVDYGSLKLWDVDAAALILYNDSDFLHTSILKAAKYANLAHEVEFFKLDCEEHEDECKRVENHETKTRPDVYFMHKGDATESWMEDYLKGGGLAKPETQEEVTASLVKWADLAAPRAKERKEKLDKEQQERWAKESKDGGGPYGGRFGGMHGRYGHGYGGYPGMGGYPYGDEDEIGEVKGDEEGKKPSFNIDEALQNANHVDGAQMKEAADAPAEAQAAEAPAEGQAADAPVEDGAVSE